MRAGWCCTMAGCTFTTGYTVHQMSHTTRDDMTATPRMPGCSMPRFDTPLVPRNSISGRALDRRGRDHDVPCFAHHRRGAADRTPRPANGKSDVSREVTIQVFPAPGRDLDAAVAKAAAVARAFPGIG